MITKVQFTNFRGFRDLTLDGLKRVNLIVGPNNCGKTSLLEGLCILCEPKQVDMLPGRLRPKGQDDETRYFRWLLRDGAQTSLGSLNAIFDSSREAASEVELKYEGKRDRRLQQRSLGISLGNVKDDKWALVHDGEKTGIHSRGGAAQRCCIVSTETRPADQLVTLFGRAQRMQDGEEALIALLKAVDPRIRKIRIDPDPKGNQIIVDTGLSELLPLTQLGQGVQRLVAIFSEVIGDSPKAVLIDEIENGVHHAVQETVWSGLATMAEQLDVQVFATTHSDECLRAAHRAFTKRGAYDFGVIQLFRMETGPQGRVLERDLIEAAMDGEIDLR
jgi:ABC-type lipoprotein export system ATPase subunit